MTAASPPHPDAARHRVLYNGRVLLGGSRPFTAIAIDGSRIAWVGDEEGARRLVDDAHEVVDLDGALVAPAFVDAHVHLAATGLNARGVDLGGAGSREHALDLIAAHARTCDDAVLLGHGWDDSRWPDGRFTRDELDRAIGPRPGYICRVDSHSAVVSGGLLRQAPQITTQDGWDASGWATRSAHQAARIAVDGLITPGQRRAALRSASRAAAAHGVAAVHELGAPHLSRLEDFRTLDDIAACEPIPHLTRYWGQLDAFDLLEPYGLAGLAGDLSCDGAIGSGTAALHEPYLDVPGRGYLYLDVDTVAEHVARCTRHGVQAGFHVIGDRAVETVLDGFLRARRTLGPEAIRAARHRVEHGELLSPDTVRTLGDLGLHASVQPSFDRAWGGTDGLYAQRLGAARAARMNPYADLLRHGVPLAFGSDTPVTVFDPWAAVGAAMRHRTPDQAIRPGAAFAAHTAGGWRAAGIDDRGTLRPGAPATYSVWRTQHPYDRIAPAEALIEQSVDGRPACLSTVLDGVVLHSPGDDS